VTSDTLGDPVGGPPKQRAADEAAEETPVKARALLSDRLFRRYWSAQTISYLGDQVSGLALPLLAVLVLNASPAQMGYLTAAGLIPNLILSLHAGVWLDRRRHRRHVMIVADVVRALLLVSIRSRTGCTSSPLCNCTWCRATR
jgi:MFS family permease